MYFIGLSVIGYGGAACAAGSMTLEPDGIRHRRENFRHPRNQPTGWSASGEKDRHPDQDENDHQQRDLDKPSKTDPGTAMPFELWIHRRHVRLASSDNRVAIYSLTVG
jgi:hypothetical protein